MTSTTTLVARAIHALAAIVLALALAPAFAQTNAIESINVSPQSGGRVLVRVSLRQPPANPPAGFTVNNPPRIALDFAATGNAMGKNVHEVSEGDLRRINVVQAGDRTRMVLELSRAVRYDTQIDGRTVLITLSSTASEAAIAAAPSTPAVTRFAEQRPGDRRHSLRD